MDSRPLVADATHCRHGGSLLDNLTPITLIFGGGGHRRSFAVKALQETLQKNALNVSQSTAGLWGEPLCAVSSSCWQQKASVIPRKYQQIT